jgi:hypothetical protein
MIEELREAAFFARSRPLKGFRRAPQGASYDIHWRVSLYRVRWVRLRPWSNSGRVGSGP